MIATPTDSHAELPVTADDGVASIKIAAALEEADREMAFVSIH